MIKVRKSTVIPPSLLEPACNDHNGQDVQAALLVDSDRKCYICEQYVNKTFQVEHHKGQAQFPDLKYDWTNLFMSCVYCNGRKSGGYDLLNPIENKIEDLIIHRLTLSKKSVLFTGDPLNPQTSSTISLLKKLFNGKNDLRDVKCKELYEYLQREYVKFLEFLVDYKTESTESNKQKIIDSLLVTKEFLAFKYWIIKDDAELFPEFQEYMLFNN